MKSLKFQAAEAAAALQATMDPAAEEEV